MAAGRRQETPNTITMIRSNIVEKKKNKMEMEFCPTKQKKKACL